MQWACCKASSRRSETSALTGSILSGWTKKNAGRHAAVSELQLIEQIVAGSDFILPFSTDCLLVTTISQYLSVAIFLTAALIRNDDKADAVPDVRRIHPAVFELVTCWNSDSEQPVVTEINLDAVKKNRNQFDLTTVVMNGDWAECSGSAGQGFRRFRIISSNRNMFVVEFQSNGGGTLTNAALIEFVIDTREIRSAGRKLPVSVLRVMSINAS